jgi:hypothetical protein
MRKTWGTRETGRVAEVDVNKELYLESLSSISSKCLGQDMLCFKRYGDYEFSFS